MLTLYVAHSGSIFFYILDVYGAYGVCSIRYPAVMDPKSNNHDWTSSTYKFNEQLHAWFSFLYNKLNYD